MAEPPITTWAANFSNGSNNPVNRVVVHATSPGMKGHSASADGQAAGTAAYFSRPATQGSAHYIVDIGPDEEHCVPDNKLAWHAPPNSNSIGVEICADSTYGRNDWLASDVWPAVQSAAWRVGELCHRFGVPRVKIDANQLKSGQRGVCSHADVAGAWGQTDHWDPGSGFPWAEFMALVTGEASTTGDDDMPAPGDVVATAQVSDRAWYQLTADGGIRVVDVGGRPIDAEPFHPYRITANDGSVYAFGPSSNGGVFSYPGLPEGSRQGTRYFTVIEGA